MNNLDLDSPMGISVFGNSIDQVKGSDLVYDSYMNEFVLGRKRILVPIGMAKMEMQKEGVTAPVFDPNDTVYYALPDDRNGDLKLTEVDMKIRAAEHEQGLNKTLDLISLKCGMGTGRYKFENGSVKTATEVISDKSDLYQNLKKNKIPINAALVAMTEALYFLAGNSGSITVTVDMDDSIIEDTNTTIDRNIKLVDAGLRSKLTAIMEINKCSEEEAQKEMEQIAEDSQITGAAVDWTGGDSVEDEEEPEDEGAEKEDEDKKDDAGNKRRAG